MSWLSSDTHSYVACDVAPRCRACDGITRAEGVRLCDRCERDGQGVIGGAQ